MQTSLIIILLLLIFLAIWGLYFGFIRLLPTNKNNLMRIKYILKIMTWPVRLLANLWMWLSFFKACLPHPNVKKRDRFFVLEDIETIALTHWKAPFTGGFEYTIPKGTILVALTNSVRLSSGFGCVPENKDEFEKQFVPENIRMNPKYAGYSFAMKYSEIGKRVRKIK
jgi:hypothetical protein